MGYCTKYNLTLHNETHGQFEAIVDRLRDKDVIGYALDEYLNTNDEVKWYDAEDDLREISKEFPEVLFELHGEGEDVGDIWNEYFKNGKVQYCKAEIVIPPFDESKLK
jgi:hypothetical protein